MADPSDLVSPSGQPLIREPKLIIIKMTKEVQKKLNPKLVPTIAKMSGCDVVVLPMDSELMMGKLAMTELESMHSACHAILEIPEAAFTKEELTSIYNTMHWAQEKLGFDERSAEVSVLKKTKKFIK